MDMDGKICCCQAALSSLQQASVDFQSNGVFPLTLSILCQICWASVFAQGTNTNCALVLFYPISAGHGSGSGVEQAVCEYHVTHLTPAPLLSSLALVLL